MFIYEILITFLFFLLSPVVFIVLVFLKEPIAGRFGFWKRNDEDLIWIHSASMGESCVNIKTSELIHELYPKQKILLSSTTKTGYENLKKNAGEYAIVRLLPIDIPILWCIAFSRVKRIKALFLVETEIWPSLLAKLYRKHIPIFLINGKLSDNSFKNYKRFLPLRILDFKGIATIEEKDMANFVKLGISEAKIRTLGNLKSAILDDMPEENTDINDWVITAGSTRKGEEEIIIDSYMLLKKEIPSLKLIIAPRHLNRLSEVENLLKERELEYKLFSENIKSGIILVDKLGVLKDLYKECKVAFIGGTLSDFGGHNPLEPVVYGKPVFFGKYTWSAEKSYRILIENECGFVVENKNDIFRFIQNLYLNNTLYNRYSQNAFEIIEKIGDETHTKYSKFIQDMLTIIYD